MAEERAPVADTFMRDSDAFSWYMERDPIMRSTIVSVAWLAHRPDWKTLVDRVEQSTRSLPAFRKRIAEPPMRLSTPRWVVDDDFDIDFHLRRIEAPPPHDDSAVVEVARGAAMTAFDPARPLWQFTLVEGLDGVDGDAAGDRAALVMRLHHSLTDGIGGMELALRLFDIDPENPMTFDGVEPPPADHVGEVDLVTGSITHDLARAGGVARHGVEGALPAFAQLVRHPGQTATDAVETARSVARTVAPVSHTLSPVMVDRGLGRRLDLLSVRLEDLKRAAARAGGKVNDGFVAGVTGGLRIYHERHGQQVDELRMTLPISIREPDDPIGGNRITLIRFTVPVGIADPVARIPLVRQRCEFARNERSLPLTNAIAGTLNLLPHQVVGGMLKHVDFVASDVPGFPFPVYLAGAKVTAMVPFGPTIGAAMNTTLLSYDGRCYISLTTDTAAIDDPDVLLDSFRAGFEEVLAIGGQHEPPIVSIPQ